MRDVWDNDHRPSPETFRQPTAYLVEVTTLSPGLPPQRLPGESVPFQNLNPESGVFRCEVMNAEGFANILAGVESNPFRIEILVGIATWGSRLRDNPRLREVTPTGKFLDGCAAW